MNKKLIWLLLTILIIFNLYNINKLAEKGTIIEELMDSNHHLVQQQDFIKSNQYIGVKNRNIEINPKISVIKPNGEEVFFLDLLEGKTKLFLYIPPFSCTSCYEKIIHNISQLDSLYKGDSIIVLATYENTNSLNNFKRVNQIRQPVYNLKKEILPHYNDDLQNPCFIEISNTGKLKSLQIIDKNFFELVYEYLEAL